MATAVYIVRPGENEELRMSLRTVAANLPEIDEVVIVGHAEPWLRDVRVIPGNPHHHDKPGNVWANIWFAATAPGLPDEVVVMNDDFMVMVPSKVGMFVRGTLADHLRMVSANGWWRRSLEATDRWLRAKGHKDPLSYELHRPFPMVRDRMAQVMREAAGVQPANPPQWRTIYGNRWEVGGELDKDFKLYRPGQIPRGVAWASTTDRSIRSVRRELGARFPVASPWERA